MATEHEDRDDILQVMYRYNHAMDGGDGDEWASCFTADGVFDAGGMIVEGHDALRALPAQAGGRGMRHLLVNPVIDVTGDAAHGRAYIVVLLGSGIGMVGSYDDELVRTADGWKLAKRVFTMDQPADAPA